MERLTGHAELQELLGAYALDAVDPEEAAAIERHLPTCPRCRTELADHREVAALLGYAGATAPGGVWDRIMASLEEPPPALRLTRAPHPDAPMVPPSALDDGSAARDLAAFREQWGDNSSSPSMPRTPAPPLRGRDDAPIVPIGSAGRRRTVPMRRLVTWVGVAALMAAVLGVAVGRIDNRKAAPTTNLAALAYRVADADASARHVTLASADGIHTVRAVVIADGTTYLGPGNLPQLPSDQTYQMWGIVDGARVSLGVIGDNPTYHVFTTPPVANVIAMTVEQRGGVVSSTKSPVVTAVIPSA